VVLGGFWVCVDLCEKRVWRAKSWEGGPLGNYGWGSLCVRVCAFVCVCALVYMCLPVYMCKRTYMHVCLMRKRDIIKTCNTQNDVRPLLTNDAVNVDPKAPLFCTTVSAHRTRYCRSLVVSFGHTYTHIYAHIYIHTHKHARASAQTYTRTHIHTGPTQPTTDSHAVPPAVPVSEAAEE
jgi:hypothetical protein